MKGNVVSQVLEITFILILLYLVLTNGSAFSQVVGASGNVYTNAVRTLQGR
jgi:hypothetical protein